MKLSIPKVLMVSFLLLCGIPSACGADADPSQTPSVAAFWDSVRRGDIDVNDPPRWVMDAMGDAAAQAEHHCAAENGEAACQEKDSQFRAMKSVAFATKSCEATYGKEQCADEHKKSDPMAIQIALGTLCDANKYSHGDSRCLAAIEAYELVQVDPDGQGILLRLYASWAENHRIRQAEANANAAHPAKSLLDLECDPSGKPVDEGHGWQGIGCLYQEPGASSGGNSPAGNHDGGANGGGAKKPGDHDLLDSVRAKLADKMKEIAEREAAEEARKTALPPDNPPPPPAQGAAAPSARPAAEEEGPPPPCTPTATTPCPKVSLKRCYFNYGVKIDLLTHSVCIFKDGETFDLE